MVAGSKNLEIPSGPLNLDKMDKEKKIDIAKHVLVPEHIKLTKEEAEQVLLSYNISFKQLPMISRKDVAIKNLDVKLGDVIKIIRKNPITGESVFYRGVM